jgi:murein DD-endopeptidase MepM/ murein hydrolase activator NlpD
VPVALVGALSLGAARGDETQRPSLMRTPSPGAVDLSAAGCAEGTLPDRDSCVHWPHGLDSLEGEGEGPDSPTEAGSHRDRRGRWVVYDQIPRRPDRPRDYDLYRYPVPCERGCVVSGYDLDRDDALQRRGRHLSHVGHGAVDLPQPKGTPVTLVPLEHQVGDAGIVFVGPLFGTTVVTRHTVREGGRERDYIVLFCHLDAAASGVRAGAFLAAGDRVGYVGDTGSRELVHLHLEARRVREGVDVSKLTAEGLVASENTVVCDPRNVLPLK